MTVTEAEAPAGRLLGAVPTESHESAAATEVTDKVPPPAFEIASCEDEAAGFDVRDEKDNRFEPTERWGGVAVTVSDTATL